MLLDKLDTLVNFVKSQVSDSVKISDDLDELNKFLQSHWIGTQTNGTFRAQLAGPMPTNEELVLLRELGLVETLVVPQKKYDGIIIVGATMKTFALRLKLLLNQGKELSSVPVYVLTSGRFLDPTLEGPSIANDLKDLLTLKEGFSKAEWPKDEKEATQFLWNWSSLSDSLKANFIYSEWQVGVSRTFSQFMRSVDEGDFLLVANQPYCGSLLMTCQRVAKTNWGHLKLDVCGLEAKDIPMKRFKDTIAKQLWEEIQCS